MNKKIKQVFAALAMACMMSICLLPVGSITALAANGTIQFSDPSATAGSEVTVNLKVSSAGGEGLSKQILRWHMTPMRWNLSAETA